MSAERLREAAALMRSRATDADEAWGSGRWSHDGLGYNDTHGMVYDIRDAQGSHLADADCEELAEHIASWHPAVALAVAGWLTTEAAHYARYYPNGHLDGDLDTASRHALAVADAYLGDAQ